MKTASVRQLRTAFPRIESWLAEGETVAITKRKKIVAELSLPRNKRKPDFAKRFGASTSVHSGKEAVNLFLKERA
jgi:antitoxin (DNA-binding transcriptional repressor) of toxin-antitoxin stability system